MPSIRSPLGYLEDLKKKGEQIQTFRNVFKAQTAGKPSQGYKNDVCNLTFGAFRFRPIIII